MASAAFLSSEFPRESLGEEPAREPFADVRGEPLFWVLLPPLLNMSFSPIARRRRVWNRSFNGKNETRKQGVKS